MIERKREMEKRKMATEIRQTIERDARPTNQAKEKRKAERKCSVTASSKAPHTAQKRDNTEENKKEEDKNSGKITKEVYAEGSRRWAWAMGWDSTLSTSATCGYSVS